VVGHFLEVRSRAANLGRRFTEGEPGREIEGPMAIAILGGLSASMALNLLILPTPRIAVCAFQDRSVGRTA
jgi:hypothetical protein